MRAEDQLRLAKSTIRKLASSKRQLNKELKKTQQELSAVRKKLRASEKALAEITVPVLETSEKRQARTGRRKKKEIVDESTE